MNTISAPEGASVISQILAAYELQVRFWTLPATARGTSTIPSAYRAVPQRAALSN